MSKQMCGYLSILLAALVCLASSAPAMAAEPEGYKAPSFIFDIRAGDSYDAVKSKQGWYECEYWLASARSLCFDNVEMMGEKGEFHISFLNGKAFSAGLMVGGDAFERMIEKIPSVNKGEITLVEIGYKAGSSLDEKIITIDFIKAVHDIGNKESADIFSRYLSPENRWRLFNVEFIPRSPPEYNQFRNGDEYKDNLPPGGVVMSLFRLSNFGVTDFSIYLPLADRKIIFPEYCAENCNSWYIPSKNNSKFKVIYNEYSAFIYLFVFILMMFLFRKIIINFIRRVIIFLAVYVIRIFRAIFNFFCGISAQVKSEIDKKAP